MQEADRFVVPSVQEMINLQQGCVVHDLYFIMDLCVSSIYPFDSVRVAPGDVTRR